MLHTHTRAGVELTADDMEVYGQFFPEPWQLTLVYRPEKNAPSRCGFFFRERNGSIRRESSHQEFTVENTRAVVPSPVATMDRPGSAAPYAPFIAIYAHLLESDDVQQPTRLTWRLVPTRCQKTG